MLGIAVNISLRNGLLVPSRSQTNARRRLGQNAGGRPLTLRQVAEWSDSFNDFGRQFQDWLHGLRSVTSRPKLASIISESPPRLARRFPEGGIADAWLAAYAEHIARESGLPVPPWCRGRHSPEPWFAVGGTDLRSRVAALRDSPPAFKSRDLYTPSVDLPLRLAAGRPAVSVESRRQANAERQRRFRVRRRLELQKLRKLTNA